MDKLKALQTVVHIAELGSLTAAAAAQGQSLPAVVRQLAALEAQLGVRLFQRSTRRVALTADGRSYLARARDILAAVADADASLQAGQATVQGPLCVTAPVLFGEQHVAALVAQFALQYPGVDLRLLLLDRFVNLVDEGVDVAIRIGELEDSSLIAQRLGAVRHCVVASPAWLRRHGTPTHPDALRTLECISYTDEAHGDWLFQDGGRRLRVPARGRLRFNHPGAALQACLAGAGVGLFLHYQVADALAQRRLRLLLPGWERPPQPVHWVLPQARQRPARVQAFLDLITPALRAVLAG